MSEQVPVLTGMQKLTASTTGWIEAVNEGPKCLFCGEPARLYQPLATGVLLGHIHMLWWCPPCETTWVD